MIEVSEFKTNYIEILFNTYKDNIKDLINVLNKYQKNYMIDYAFYYTYEPKKLLYLKLKLKGKTK